MHCKVCGPGVLTQGFSAGLTDGFVLEALIRRQFLTPCSARGCISDQLPRDGDTGPDTTLRVARPERSHLSNMRLGRELFLSGQSGL
jgi:hypothetical protein